MKVFNILSHVRFQLDKIIEHLEKSQVIYFRRENFLRAETTRMEMRLRSRKNGKVQDRWDLEWEQRKTSEESETVGKWVDKRLGAGVGETLSEDKKETLVKDTKETSEKDIKETLIRDTKETSAEDIKEKKVHYRLELDWEQRKTLEQGRKELLQKLRRLWERKTSETVGTDVGKRAKETLEAGVQETWTRKYIDDSTSEEDNEETLEEVVADERKDNTWTVSMAEHYYASSSSSSEEEEEEMIIGSRRKSARKQAEKEEEERNARPRSVEEMDEERRRKKEDVKEMESQRNCWRRTGKVEWAKRQVTDNFDFLIFFISTAIHVINNLI